MPVMLTEQMPHPLVRHLQASFPQGWKLPVQFEVKILDLVFIKENLECRWGHASIAR